jgi:UDP-N-acetylglucosamine 2-epimerase (non-hydrolysing)
MILLTYGTRPEYIKVKPLIDILKLNLIPFKTLFTGQHKDIVTIQADYNLEMIDYGGNRLDSVIKNCLSIPNEYFENVTHVLVQGDTTSVLGIALTAYHRRIKIIHLEAGLRTYDMDNPFPEEANRQLVSKIADIHLCPTESNRKNLTNELIGGIKVVVGNTGLDNLVHLRDKCEYTNKVLVTLHRRENHDKIDEWFTQVDELAKDNPHLEFILPIHPNPNVIKHKDLLKHVLVINPLKHNELLDLLIKTRLVITDSGGLQEECSFFKKKCLVCRKITERPESVGTSSFLINEPSNLSNIFYEHIKNYEINNECPFGDGYSSQRIAGFIKCII